jgi:hypothetical protein
MEAATAPHRRPRSYGPRAAAAAFRLAAQPGKSQGRPLEVRAQLAQRARRPAQPAVSQEAPVPVDRTYVGYRMTAPPTEHFQSARCARLGSRRDHTHSGTTAVVRVDTTLAPAFRKKRLRASGTAERLSDATR